MYKVVIENENQCLVDEVRFESLDVAKRVAKSRATGRLTAFVIDMQRAAVLFRAAGPWR